MIRIGLSQRVTVAAPSEERRDCLDQRWHALLARAGIQGVPIPNSPDAAPNLFSALQLQGFLLTGGNDLNHLPGAADSAPERDQMERHMLDFARIHSLPVLGVCRGLQVINHVSGGELVRVSGHAGTRHALQKVAEGKIPGTFDEVNSYHNWGVRQSGLGAQLTAVLKSPDGVVEALVHDELQWTAIMWHPEREEPFRTMDIELLQHCFRTMQP